MARTPGSSLRRASREPSAFADVYSAYSRQLLIFFMRRTFDLEAARDLTAETFAQAFRDRRRFRGRSDREADAWIYGIARNLLSHYGRKGRVERKAVERLGIQLPSIGVGDYERVVELAGLAELRERVSHAFADLSDDQRLALRLRVIEELPYAEVAETLRVSEQTARARVSRALRRLTDVVDLTPPSPEVTS
jgi:RNA polymerase sigma factor (sigma-70 family)